MRLGLAFVALLLFGLGFSESCGGDEEQARESQATATPRPSMVVTPSESPVPWPTDWSVSVETNGGSRALLGDGTHIWILEEALEEFERYELAFEADLDGDRVEEAIVSYYSGGAHCCLEYRIFSSSRPGIEEGDSFSLGNGSVSDVTDLDGDGIPEILASDDRLLYFRDVTYASSPYLPLVLCRKEGGTYGNCTEGFPTTLDEAAAEFEGRLEQASNEGIYPDAIKGAALGLLASRLLSNEEDLGWAKVEALCADCASWLRDNDAELRERLAEAIPYGELPR